MGRDLDTIRDGGAIRRMFGGIAVRYDLLNHLLSLGRDRTWRRQAVAAAGAEGPVLDVCAGTGDMALEWTGALPDGTPVLAADFCPEMLVLFRRKVAATNGGRRVLVLGGDTLKLPFADNVFGAVSVAFGIRNVTDLRAGIREMIRVTRPGGRVVILEFTKPTNPLFRPVYFFYFMVVLPFVGNLVSGTRENAYGYLPRSVMNFPGRGRLLEILGEEGLGDVHAENLSMGIVNVLLGTKSRR